MQTRISSWSSPASPTLLTCQVLCKAVTPKVQEKHNGDDASTDDDAPKMNVENAETPGLQGLGGLYNMFGLLHLRFEAS